MDNTVFSSSMFDTHFNFGIELTWPGKKEREPPTCIDRYDAVAVHFDADGYAIPQREMPFIGYLTSWMKNHHNCRIRVAGFCTKKSGKATNAETNLCRERINTVIRYIQTASRPADVKVIYDPNLLNWDRGKEESASEWPKVIIWPSCGCENTNQ
jgi:hypothetical protein